MVELVCILEFVLLLIFSEQITCADQIQVIQESDLCDGTVQCIDGSDENHECCK